ncbi:MAG: EAL domain-containing protein [Mycobacterium sp.]
MYGAVSVKELVRDLFDSIDPLALARRVAEQACLLLPDVDGAVVVLHLDGRPVVVSAHGTLDHLLGSTAPTDLDLQPRATTHVEPGRCSVLSTPLVRGGTALGWVSIVSANPLAIDDGHIVAMSAASRFISTLLNANAELAEQLHDLMSDPPAGTALDPTTCFLTSLIAPDAALRQQVRAELTDAADPDRLRAVFQPIRYLSDLSVTGYEGLSRFLDGCDVRPDHWFAKADQIGRRRELELTALETVLNAANAIPPRFDLWVNLSPNTAAHPTARELLRCSGRRVTIELTEHEEVGESTYAALEDLRRDGVRLAVDDTGAGFSSLNRILRLRPDVIKLDRELTAGVETDPARQALATSLVYFAQEIGATTVAEGIENAEQLRTLHEIGIQYGQGFWLGRPEPAPVQLS